jgi:hypothetical protein
VHGLLSLQTGAEPPTQTLAAQVSLVVQASPSLQLAVLALKTQPLAGLQLSSVHRLLSSQTGAEPPTQALSAQVSLVVQALPSSQLTELATYTQPETLSQLSSVHRLLSSQTGAEPPTQTLSAQVSLVVQASPSLQLAVLEVKTQPLAGLQLSSVHGLLSLQTGAEPPTQTLAAHVSLVVQALPSLQLAVLAVKTHPIDGLQLSDVHGLLSLQVIRLPGEQTPAPSQVSDPLQALPSEQVVPLVLFGLLHKPLAGSQVPAVWHWSDAEQVTGLDPVQAPARQVSDWVQALPSLQLAVLLAKTQPEAGLQLSVVQTLLSLQVVAPPLPQVPVALQVSPVVQALPSLQAPPLASHMHAEEQQSPLAVLPSSHCSVPVITPSLQT